MKVRATTVYPFIFFRDSIQEIKDSGTRGRDLFKHEWTHIHQYRANYLFVFQYLWEQISKGYKQNKYEIAARNQEHKDFTPEELAAWNEDTNWIS